MSDVLTAEVYKLDSRYGLERKCFGLQTAQDMARLDDIIEAAGIVPGDKVEILWRRWERNYEIRKMEERHVWAVVEDATFLEIDNGRFRIQDPEGRRAGGFELENILDVRKVTPPKLVNE